MYDIVICSCGSDRRINILSKLKENNIICHVIHGLWGSLRDEIIGKAKILLNIHNYDNFTIYESIRCDRWVLAGQLVISETSNDDNYNDLKDLLILSDYDNLVNTVINVVNNYKKYNDEYLIKLNLNKQSIISQRKNYIYDLKKIINDI